MLADKTFEEELHPNMSFLNKLVYYEETTSIESAIEREKQLKGYARSKKDTLIITKNPYWEDLSENWYV